MISERAKQRQAKKGKPQQVKYVQYLTDGSYTPPRKTPSRNYVSPKNTWPKLHYPEHTFP